MSIIQTDSVHLSQVESWNGGKKIQWNQFTMEKPAEKKYSVQQQKQPTAIKFIWLTPLFMTDENRSFARSKTWILVSNYCIRCVWLSHLFICTFQLEITLYSHRHQIKMSRALSPSLPRPLARSSLRPQFTSFNDVIFSSIYFCAVCCSDAGALLFSRPEIQCKGHGNNMYLPIWLAGWLTGCVCL